MDHETIELAFIIVAAAAFVLQMIILFGMYLATRKAVSKMQSDFEQLKNSVTPVIESAVPILKSAGPMVETARVLVTRMAPKLEAAGNDLAATARGVREQGAALHEATQQMIDRVNQQAHRVDAMVSDALDSVDRAGSFVVRTVDKPVRQISGILAAVKAVLDALRSYQPPMRRAHSATESEPLVR
jgi:ABC-type transporter Mla subunit MlaD